MTDHYRVVVIGGGIVGVSVLYHLARAGWTDIALIERAELTAGSSWHAAGGFHALNSDPNIAALQSYTIELYEQIEKESGQAVGLHSTGGVELAGTPERWEWLKSEWALFQTLDINARLMDVGEIEAMFPIVNLDGLEGGLFDPQEGHLDPHGATHAFAIAARKLGAKTILRNRVTGLTQLPDKRWLITTEKGDFTAEHVVNAAGLWARRVGRMAGVDLPLVPMEHHFLVTDSIPELAALEKEMPSITDLDGFTYLQQEGTGVLLGVYERNPVHWRPQGAAWDFGMDLLPEAIDRIEHELLIGFERFPVLKETGIKRWVNGAFTFTPDGNPLIGPVPGLQNYWAACGCMAGFSQGGAIGLALANWMTEGDPGFDVFGMDVARFGSYACNDKYLADTTRQFYARRFSMAYPNEELPAGRPLKTSPCYDALKSKGAHFGEIWGMETPLFFVPDDPDFAEVPSLRRSNTHPVVAREVAATRTSAGLFETGIYARYEVSGPGAEKWLDYMLASRIPAVGRVRLAPMLSPAGTLMGDLTVSRLADDRFWLVGSYFLQEWHLRWFREHLPRSGVRIENLSESWLGFSLSGPGSRDILCELTSAEVSNAALPFLSCQKMNIATTQAVVARISLTGELGYEISVPAIQQRALWSALCQAGEPFGMRQIGLRALDSLRFEKAYGSWGTEFAQSYTPGMSGLDHFVALDKGDFIGRDAAAREQQTGASQKLVLLQIEATDADVAGYEPVWAGGNRVGFMTSGGYGHHVGMSLALAYVDRGVVESKTPLSTHIVGEERNAHILEQAPYDPAGLRIRV
ncbi:MAG: FAD-dependent oxidoreductase [Gammaproteobacteria bacterium]|nr:FAD-dependent oxidoreductase [Gammaproteobacteria bacterium]